MDAKKQEKLSLLTELIKLARVDLEVREIEYQFLLAIAAQLKVTPNEFQHLFDEYIEFTPPENEFDRILQLQRLILLSNVDLENSEKELDFIRNCGIKMGLNPLAIDEVLVKMHEFENKIIPPNELIQIFMRFNN